MGLSSRFRIRAFLLPGAIFLCGGSTLFSAGEKILFVGNSFTHGSGGTTSVPDIFSALARAGGQGNPLVEMRAVSGTDFQYHYDHSLGYFNQESWTHVVLQNYSTQPTHIGDIPVHYDYGELLYQAAIDNNPDTQIYLYQTWARSSSHAYYTDGTFDSPEAMLGEVRTHYTGLAQQLNAVYPSNPPVQVSPVGDAWKNAGGSLDPEDAAWIDLYSTDQYHGNDNGYYLSACVHYAMIFQASPVGLFETEELEALQLSIDPITASLLEQVAWETARGSTGVFRFLSAKPISTQKISLFFNESPDPSIALNPANYRIANRGKFIGIKDVEAIPDTNEILLSLDADLVGNFGVGCIDPMSQSGNPFVGPMQHIGNAGGLFELFIDLGGTFTV
ncbi:MAG: SGNH/GDSL hydrolase family protein, partial [Puniceicoccales bacterium]